jgi:hypothetical protein
VSEEYGDGGGIVVVYRLIPRLKAFEDLLKSEKQS